MTRRAFHSLTAAISALALAAVLAPLASAETESFAVFPYGQENGAVRTKTDFDFGEEYRVLLSGTINVRRGVEDPCIHDAFWWTCPPRACLSR